MKKIFLTVLAFFLLIAPVAAVGNEQGQNGTPSQGIAKTGNQNQLMQSRCDAVTTRVDNVTNRYNENKLRYMNAFENVAKKVDDMIAQLKVNGYDTAKLEQDMVRVRSMIQNTNRYYASFQNGLENSKQFACGNGSGDYARELNQAREQLRLAKQEMLQLRQFIQTTVRADLNEIRDQIAQ